MIGDQNTRFQHLLQPIRNLAKNWDVDIAGQLEDYLDEVDVARFKINIVNFLLQIITNNSYDISDLFLLNHIPRTVWLAGSTPICVVGSLPFQQCGQMT